MFRQRLKGCKSGVMRGRDGRTWGAKTHLRAPTDGDRPPHPNADLSVPVLGMEDMGMVPIVPIGGTGG